MENPDSTAFRVGGVFSLTFSELVQHPVLYLGFSFLGSSLFLFRAMVFSGRPGGGGLLFFPVGLFTMAVFSAAVTAAVCGSIAGERVGTGKALLRGLDKLFPLFILACVCLIVVTVLVALNIASSKMGVWWVGALLTIFIFLHLGLTYLIVTPVCVAENLRAVESLKRSRALSRGRRGKIFLLLIIPFIIGTSLNFSLSQIFTARFNVVGDNIAVTFSQPFHVAFFTVLIACVHHRLRVAEDARESAAMPPDAPQKKNPVL